MRVIAQRGETDFLVDLENDGLGRVVDVAEEKAYIPFNLVSIYARGYWEEVADEAGAESALEIVRQESGDG